ncbi:MAG TPA: mevalonate kinase [Legionella sp.]|nr:mevalonate kinase [Legionella sp.]
MCCNFQTTTHGKWILAGEHAVLRGHPALVYPIPDKTLTLHYQTSTAKITLDCSGEQGDVIPPLFWSVFEHGLRLLNTPQDTILGQVQVQSNIPIGVGLGASAALCVAISRWFASLNLLSHEQIQPFAQELEHLFHGQSSGVDVVGAAAIGGVYFQQGVTSAILQAWSPDWRLSNCGDVGMTAPCVQAVQALWQTNAAHAEAIDHQMRDSVCCARAALEDKSPSSREKLAAAIHSAADCFQQWGLVTPRLQHHMQTLRDNGALAVKPTGSGGGGYVMSLWP